MIENYLPKDFYWLGAKAKGKNLKALFKGLNKEIIRANNKSKEVLTELDIRKTENLLSEWENMLGIPGTILTTLGTSLEKRRQAVLVKLAALCAQNSQSFVDIAALFGYNIIVISNVDNYFPGNLKESKFTFMIDFIGKGESPKFTLTFPINFQENTDDIFEFFRTLIPANVSLLRYYDCPYVDWQNELLTENGEMGENHFAVDATEDSSNAYKAFDGDFTTSWSFDGTNDSKLICYIPYPLVLQEYSIRLANQEDIDIDLVIEGSSDKTNWETIIEESASFESDITKVFKLNISGSYRYLRFTFSSSNSNINLSELSLKGVYSI